MLKKDSENRHSKPQVKDYTTGAFLEILCNNINER
jgi:hypothetical protein